MKHLGIFPVILILALCETSAGADKTNSTKATQGGARVQEKAVVARRMPGLMQGAKAPALILLLRVETRMENDKQMIVATATAHTGGQNGPLAVVDGLNVRVTQPAQFRKDGRRTNTTVATRSIDASDGKFKTVVADATMTSQGIDDTRVSVKVQ